MRLSRHPCDRVPQDQQTPCLKVGVCLMVIGWCCVIMGGSNLLSWIRVAYGSFRNRVYLDLSSLAGFNLRGSHLIFGVTG